MKRYLILLIVVFNSCKSSKNHKELNIDIYYCIEKRSTEYANNLFNIYDYYIEVEKILIQKGYLLNKSKKGYKKLLSELFNSKNNQNNIQLHNEIFKQLEYSEMLIQPGILLGAFECNRYILKKHKLNENIYYSRYYLNLKSIVDDMSIDNHTLYFNLIKNTPNENMNEIIFRAPLLATYIAFLDYYVTNGKVK